MYIIEVVLFLSQLLTFFLIASSSVTGNIQGAHLFILMLNTLYSGHSSICRDIALCCMTQSFSQNHYKDIVHI